MEHYERAYEDICHALYLYKDNPYAIIGYGESGAVLEPASSQEGEWGSKALKNNDTQRAKTQKDAFLESSKSLKSLESSALAVSLDSLKSLKSLKTLESLNNTLLEPLETQSPKQELLSTKAALQCALDFLKAHRRLGHLILIAPPPDILECAPSLALLSSQGVKIDIYVGEKEPKSREILESLCAFGVVRYYKGISLNTLS
ncbi:MAG: hypothetical protein J1E28_02305 [Helicobacter sp.]|uniref:hypothetical protein n=1 Tax=Helicobacter sp. TaxID=218 RepID=UPI0025BF762D|nr:hypothetical protein [Helicobacter sp.]MCH5313219.1 hypothetical protein [Helicobacter sp.]